MIISNCNIIFRDAIKSGSVIIRNNKIISVNTSDNSYMNNIDDEEIIDADGLYLSPGFIDSHIHGAGGCDVMDGTYESLNTISNTIMKHGTTSFVPTTMTCDVLNIKQAVEVASNAKVKGTDGAQILGVHLEGPFINPKMTGAQNPEFVQPPFKEMFENIVGSHADIINKITLAPEIDGADELIKHLCKKGITVSIGHSNASYNEALKGIASGISHSTHLYNAMAPLHHREPGIVGAIFDTDITTEIICDGIHIAYPALRIAVKQKGIDKITLITDAMRACCISDGTYSLGGQTVYVKDGAARLENGILAGSVLTIDKAVKNLSDNSNYSLNEIIAMATCNAAKHCKVDDTKGMIKEGYDADLILFDNDINIKMVIIAGKITFKS